MYFATALAFLRLHEAEILLGEDIADVVRAHGHFGPMKLADFGAYNFCRTRRW